MDINSKKQKALELKSQGLSYQQIADEIGVSKTTAFYWATTPRENSAEDTNTELLPGEDSLKEVKRELSKLRNQLAEAMNNNENVPEMVELRRLELEHEYRMEELENTRQENLSETKVRELQERLDQLKSSFEQSQQKLQDLAGQNNALQSKISFLGATNRRLEDKIANMEEPIDDSPENSAIFLSEIYIDRLKILFDEYLEFNNNVCDQESLESFYDQTTELQNEIEIWSMENDFNYAESVIKLFIDKFIMDIKEAISSFEENDDDELVLEIDSAWISKMKDQLDDL
jgi:chromosome segregation ATPase